MPRINAPLLNFICIAMQGFVLSTFSAAFTSTLLSATPKWPHRKQMQPVSPLSFRISEHSPNDSEYSHASRKRLHILRGGVGIAADYTWREEQFEIEVHVQVPAGTKAKDVKFKCSVDSIDLQLVNTNDRGSETEKGSKNGESLLDGTRKTRGRICVDGTFWSIADAALAAKEGSDKSVPNARPREITITIEKFFPPTSFDAITDFDWGGVYPEDNDEVSHRKYDEAQELDVREYAAKLGVDIDNINMTMVDTSMFGSGLNMSRSAMDQLTKTGYAKEVAQQADGSEYEVGGSGEEKKFSPLGTGITDEELQSSGSFGGGAIPEMWRQSVPVEEVRDEDGGREDGIIREEIEEREVHSSSDKETISVAPAKDESQDLIDLKTEQNDNSATDPIDLLTVARLKDILRAQGLKVSGKKQELRDRLRKQVKSMLREESS